MTPRKQIRVILDTNFLMVPVRFGVDIKSEIGRIVEASFILTTTPAVVDELRRIKNQVKPSEVKDVDFALSLAETLKKIDDVLTLGEDVDDQLLRLAGSGGFLVATTDAELRRRLRSKGLPAIYLRQSRFLAIDGLIKNICSK
jgi:rRNA-processing protein FCF1